MAPPGKLFVFEGPDGVGKTTLSKAFSDHLNATGIQCDYLSFPGRETGSLGRHIYELHHDPDRFGIRAVDPASLQLLHIAAHIDWAMYSAQARGRTICDPRSILVVNLGVWSGCGS
jgi:thymidylate kinase